MGRDQTTEQLPSGTVSFLFTDIEGSTARWERQPAAMQQAVARHDALMRTSIGMHGGLVFKTVGDAFYAVFVTAGDAVAAAISAQQALLQEPWESVVAPLRVRMAIHSGTAEQRDADYFGPALNRVARLLASGAGGQILLSAAAQELVRDFLPPDTGLLDLGEHRLKDLIRPEHIFQLVAPGLPDGFPPLRTLESRPNNLPIQLTPLIGRETEVAAVQQLVRRSDVHLVTLTGPGGTGKTRLALQVAAELIDVLDAGVSFIDLAPLEEAALVIPTIARTLDVREEASRPLQASLAGFLRDRQLLLVLDNFEQIIDAAADVATLLAACPRLKMLVTSRESLRIRGEYEFPVPPLALPDPQQLPVIGRLSQYAAVRLFIERVVAVRPDFTVTNANAPAIAEICVRLDGLPLAIELAAARIRLFPPEVLLARLGQRLKLLSGGARDLPARQQTLRNAIAWSYDLLGDEEKILFRRLAIFNGGATFEAADAVCAAPGDLAIDLLDGLTSLINKSLVQQRETTEHDPRYTMLELIREYGLERLEPGEAEELRRSHGRYFLAFATAAEPELRGPHAALWLNRLEREHDNLRAVLQWSSKSGDATLGLQLAGVLWHFWDIRGHFAEGLNWLQTVLAQTTNLTLDRVAALHGATVLAGYRGDYQAAHTYAEEGLALVREAGDRHRIAQSLNELGVIAYYRGDAVAARAYLEESLALKRTLGDHTGSSITLGNLALAAWLEHDYQDAQAYLEESLAIDTAVGDTQGMAITLSNLGQVVAEQGRSGAARVLLGDSLKLFHELGDKDGIATSIEGLAKLAAAAGESQKATRWYGVIEALRVSIGVTLPPSERSGYEHVLETLRTALGEAQFAAALAEGRAMTVEQAIRDALASAADEAEHP